MDVVERLTKQLSELSISDFRIRMANQGGHRAGRRFGDAETLREETAAWSTDVNNAQRGVVWQMTIDDARSKLISVYPIIRL